MNTSLDGLTQSQKDTLESMVINRWYYMISAKHWPFFTELINKGFVISEENTIYGSYKFKRVK